MRTFFSKAKPQYFVNNIFSLLGYRSLLRAFIIDPKSSCAWKTTCHRKVQQPRTFIIKDAWLDDITPSILKSVSVHIQY